MKLAVMGRNADATTNMQGNYFGTAPYLISPKQGPYRRNHVPTLPHV